MGISACEWGRKDLHCSAFMTEIKDPRVNSTDDSIKCFKFESESENGEHGKNNHIIGLVIRLEKVKKKVKN